MPPEKRVKRDANGSDNSDSSSGSADLGLGVILARSRGHDATPSTSLENQEMQIISQPRSPPFDGRRYLEMSTGLNRLFRDYLEAASTSTAGPSNAASIMEKIEETMITLHNDTYDIRAPTTSNEISSRSQDRSASESRNNPVTAQSTVNSTEVLPHRLSSAVSVLTTSRNRLTRGRPNEASTSQSSDQRYRRGVAHSDRRYDRRHERTRRTDPPRDFRPRTSMRSRTMVTASRRTCPLHSSHSVIPSGSGGASSAAAHSMLRCPLDTPIMFEHNDLILHKQFGNKPCGATSAGDAVLDAFVDAGDEISDDEIKNETVAEPEGYEELNKKILATMECPVCFDVMSPPMSQCRRGHLVCLVCRQRLSQCPTCRAPFTNRRNLYMERVTELLHYPCRHAGCTAQVNLTTRLEHEANCRLRPRHCAFGRLPTCSIQSSVPSLLNHYRRNHNSFILEGPAQQVRVSMPQHDWIIIAHRRMFLLNITTTVNLTVSVQYYGQQQMCQDFLYTVELSCSGSKSRSYHYTREVHSDMETLGELQRSHDTFCVPSVAAKKFEKNNEGDLQVNIEILDIRPQHSHARSQAMEWGPVKTDSERNIGTDANGNTKDHTMKTSERE